VATSPATEPVPAAQVADGGASYDSVEALIRARVSSALGGVRGSVESALPTIAFVVAWVWTHEIRTSVVASAGVVAVLLVVALLTRSTLRYVGSAVLANAFAAFLALRSGRAEAAFLPGILTSAGFLLVTLLSVVVRWPLVGFIVAAGDPDLADDPTGWHRDRALVRVCQRLTLVLVGLFALRVAIMVPLYAAHQVTLLGAAKLVLSWPAYLAALAVMAAILVRGRTPPVTPASAGSAYSG
jgi:hypothetical protein